MAALPLFEPEYDKQSFIELISISELVTEDDLKKFMEVIPNDQILKNFPGISRGFIKINHILITKVKQDEASSIDLNLEENKSILAEKFRTAPHLLNHIPDKIKKIILLLDRNFDSTSSYGSTKETMWIVDFYLDITKILQQFTPES